MLNHERTFTDIIVLVHCSFHTEFSDVANMSCYPCYIVGSLTWKLPLVQSTNSNRLFSIFVIDFRFSNCSHFLFYMLTFVDFFSAS